MKTTASVSSVVGPYLGDFQRSLEQRRYQPSTIRHYLVQCETFDSFLVENSVALSSLQADLIGEFVASKLVQRRHRDEHGTYRS